MRDPAHRVPGLLQEHLRQQKSTTSSAMSGHASGSYDASDCLSEELLAKLELFGLDIVVPLALDW